MSAVTLETLLADLLEAQAQYRAYLMSSSTAQLVKVAPRLALADEVDRKGAIYDIACDHGLQAAMLYKLSDGAQDPREVR